MNKLNRIVLSRGRKTTPKSLSVKEFGQHSQILFSTVKKAMTSVSKVAQDDAETLTVHLSPSSSSSSSVFELTVNAKNKTIVMQSPISGEKIYQYNRLSQRWEDTTDGHDIQGLLTRDFMRLSPGVPLF